MKAVMYHYVRPDDPGLPHFRHLHLEDFRRQLSHFEREYGFVSKPAFERAVRMGEPCEGVVLTFDDGFKDHYRYVLPELARRQLWGIFYIPTASLSTGRLLDVHRIHVLLGTKGGHVVAQAAREIVSDGMLSHAHIEEFQRDTYTHQNNSDSTQYVKRLLNYYIDYKHRSFVLGQLVRLFLGNEEQLAENYYMNPAELGEMREQGMVLGSHTVTHPVMSKLSVEDQKKEIATSFYALEAILGNSSWRTFCYPYGGFHSFTEQTEQLLESAGCLCSFNVEHRDIERKDLRERRQALPRFDCNSFPYGQCRRTE